MPATPPINVVLCWHMHQPDYRDHRRGRFELPWTYLHAIKDYVDMAAHLEAYPAAKAVVNFAPVLLEQIVDYGTRLDRALSATAQGETGDSLLDALISALPPERDELRLELIRACLRANEHRLIKRYPQFAQIADLARWLLDHPVQLQYIAPEFFSDLVTWYHLAWLGESVRRQHDWVQQLIARGGPFSHADRLNLAELIRDLLLGVLPRYKALAKHGQVELALSPYAHPIVPLLLDLRSAREAWPQAELPDAPAYPGGAERARWHMDHGMAVFKQQFGFKPAGCWPSEGSVSVDALKLFAESGFQWVATGQAVLHNSRQASGLDHKDGACQHAAYQAVGTDIACFFRDDGLSDLIGFRYSDWHAEDAVGDFIHHLENLGRICAADPDSVVPIILDGENAWEYYPENGHHFLDALYRRLSAYPGIRLCTFSDYLQNAKPRPLPKLVAGSWVYGTFSTWIGERDKNRGWQMLITAKQAFDSVAPKLSPARRAEAERQLAVCEGSDWFWWFGDYNPEHSISDFERLFRLQLANLYTILGLEPPEWLSHRFAQAGGGAVLAGGVMRKVSG